MDATLAFPVISAALAGFLLLMQQVLMLSAGIRRGSTGQGVGVAGDVQLERKVRRHGNLAENAAIFVAALALLELLIGSSTIVLVFAALFLGSRLSHAVGFSTLRGSHVRIDGEKAPGSRVFLALRSVGATLTALSGIALGAYLVLLTVGNLPL